MIVNNIINTILPPVDKTKGTSQDMLATNGAAKVKGSFSESLSQALDSKKPVLGADLVSLESLASSNPLSGAQDLLLAPAEVAALSHGAAEMDELVALGKDLVAPQSQAADTLPADPGAVLSQHADVQTDPSLANAVSITNPDAAIHDVAKVGRGADYAPETTSFALISTPLSSSIMQSIHYSRQQDHKMGNSDQANLAVQAHGRVSLLTQAAQASLADMPSEGETLPSNATTKDGAPMPSASALANHQASTLAASAPAVSSVPVTPVALDAGMVTTGLAANEGGRPLVGTAPLVTEGTQVRSEVASGQWGKDIGQQLVSMIRRGSDKMEIRLNPAELGPLSISLKLNDSQAQAQFVTHSALVRQALEMAMPQLREAMAQQGIDLAQSDVSERQQSEQGQKSAFARNDSMNDGREVDESLVAGQTVDVPRSHHDGLISAYA